MKRASNYIVEVIYDGGKSKTIFDDAIEAASLAYRMLWNENVIEVNIRIHNLEVKCDLTKPV